MKIHTQNNYVYFPIHNAIEKNAKLQQQKIQQQNQQYQNQGSFPQSTAP